MIKSDSIEVEFAIGKVMDALDSRRETNESYKERLIGLKHCLLAICLKKCRKCATIS